MAYDDLVFTTLTAGEEPVFHLVIQGPRDGYRAYAASVNTGLEQLIQNDVVLQDASTAINTNLNRLPGQSATSTYAMSLDMNGLYDTDMWRCYSIDIPDTTDHLPTMRQIHSMATTLPLTLKVPNLPDGTKITAITVRCFNPSPSSIPATKPSVSFRSRHPITTSSSTYYVTKQVDPTTSISTYQHPHLITLSLDVDVNNLNEYYVDLFGDSFGSGLSYMSVLVSTTKS